MKKLISVILILSLVSTQAALPNKAYAWWWSDPQPMNKDLSFRTIYPVPFWSSTTGIGMGSDVLLPEIFVVMIGA